MRTNNKSFLQEYLVEYVKSESLIASKLCDIYSYSQSKYSSSRNNLQSSGTGVSPWRKPHRPFCWKPRKSLETAALPEPQPRQTLQGSELITILTQISQPRTPHCLLQDRKARLFFNLPIPRWSKWFIMANSWEIDLETRMPICEWMMWPGTEEILVSVLRSIPHFPRSQTSGKIYFLDNVLNFSKFIYYNMFLGHFSRN